MAAQSAQDVVTQSQSGGDLSPSDVPATTTNADIHPSGEAKSENAGDTAAATATTSPKENGIHSQRPGKIDDLEDASSRSDTDTSRAEGSVAGDKTGEPKAIKKFPVTKPVSFAKYSVPKVIAANAAANPASTAAITANKPTDRSSTPTSAAQTPAPIGRPRLVAKTTSSLQQKAQAARPTAPDPMQVWNKNRVTPQPSTKHLTDEELKQQYGIHLTSRLQTDADGKEAKWADIDDDEDDWAPETIEWNDGTKTTLAATEMAAGVGLHNKPASDSQAVADGNGDADGNAEPDHPPPPQFASSVGPNATVLKLGASAERQQAQKAAAAGDKSRGPLDKTAAIRSRTAPAPTPSKSPWAALPPVDKVSPVAINPQPLGSSNSNNSNGGGNNGPLSRYPGGMTAYNRGLDSAPLPTPSSPFQAKEISADDFNRSWKDSSINQPRELFMPSSGRYEAVPDSRRRMSKNEQGMRAPALLQRPTQQQDNNTPAEPSAAFQTKRTSHDAGRRRASSIISGGSGQLARRLSIKSGDPPSAVTGSHESVGRPGSSEGPPSQVQTPGTNDFTASALAAPIDIEAEREKQKIAMKEKIEAARQRKQEEEARLEAEKQERIAKRLAALPPLPVKDESVSKKMVVVEVGHKQAASGRLDTTPDSANPSSAHPTPLTSTVSRSPPKPPQPLATGEPQQYGLMKVHALDAVKKMGIPTPSLPDHGRHQGPAPAHSHASAPSPAHEHKPLQVDESGSDSAKTTTSTNGHGHIHSHPHGHKAPDTGAAQRTATVADPLGPSELSPKFSKPASVAGGSDTRGGWADLRDHRSPASGNLWGTSSNKALGNGTFDHRLAGFASQDLSRTSSTAQGWMSTRTPLGGRSPQQQYAATSSSLHPPPPPLISPDQPPLAADSEADPLFPSVRPAPIAPPHVHHQTRAMPNEVGPSSQQHQQPNGSLPSWNNFHTVSVQQDRAENDRYQRDIAPAKRDDELRSGGSRHGPWYNFNETWKQVNVGDPASQRHLTAVHQSVSSAAASPSFGPVGTVHASEASPRLVNGHPTRGSRFFPAPSHANGQHDRRAVTYSHPDPDVPRSPSPPPAEEYASYHPVFDGDCQHPTVKLPREKPVVKLPSPESATATADATGATTTTSATATTTRHPTKAAASPVAPPPPQQPMSWAAKVAMPAPISSPSPKSRTVSSPTVQNSVWQERFRGLLNTKPTPKDARDAAATTTPSEIAPVTREPLEVLPHNQSAAVSMPQGSAALTDLSLGQVSVLSTKHVDDEADLFEDRELASLPLIVLPYQDLLPLPLWPHPREISPPVESSTIPHLVLTNNPTTRPFRHDDKAQYVIVRLPHCTKSIKRDLPLRITGPRPQSAQKSRNNKLSAPAPVTNSSRRFRGGRSRHTPKA